MQEVVLGLSGKPDKLYAEGLHVAGERYVLTKAEDRSLYARKVGGIPLGLLPKLPSLPTGPQALVRCLQQVKTN
jgi:hypothetical protein